MGLGKREVIESLKYRYAEDLYFIKHFKSLLRGDVSSHDYLDGSLRECLKSYRVAKVIRAGKKEDILHLTMTWIKSGREKDVDGLAQSFKTADYTNGLPLALASVLLFLNNPGQVLPLDTYSRMALGCVENNYLEYLNKAQRFRDAHADAIREELQHATSALAEIEQKVGFNADHAEVIREQCYLHRWLRYLGKEYGVNAIVSGSMSGIKPYVKSGAGRSVGSGGD